MEENKKMLESRITAGAIEKSLGWETSHAKTVAGSCDIDGHAKKCVERFCELANKKVEQLYKVSAPCLLLEVCDSFDAFQDKQPAAKPLRLQSFG